ncbi:Ribosomal RNA small subunit methyltransferase J [Candidatus Magnetaquicoccaceae bacterium FCR-1]|uniref:Ribosomal RNA small subunit methyltransferase J n=1 Tax=Candidatus Magnetaquiglobus chichijimensis TaxID=3141448 RepID=A0ABQ0C9Q6_9PROT
MSLVVTTPEPESIPAAQRLAARLGVPFLAWAETGERLVLSLRPERLELVARNRGRGEPVCVDFSSTIATARRQEGIKQDLARAVGLKGGWRPSVLDATPGLGRDGFVLAALGCRVTFVERSPVIHALLADGLKRARESALPESERMTLIQDDAAHHLNDHSACQRPDVIYLDPMHPERTKAALVKKEMRLLRQVVGEDGDADGLVDAALRIARQRVVVKRPRLAIPLGERVADAVIEGKSVRYDLYFTDAHLSMARTSLPLPR